MIQPGQISARSKSVSARSPLHPLWGVVELCSRLWSVVAVRQWDKRKGSIIMLIDCSLTECDLSWCTVSFGCNAFMKKKRKECTHARTHTHTHTRTHREYLFCVMLCVSEAKQVLNWCVGHMTACYIVCQMQSRCWSGVWAARQWGHSMVLCQHSASTGTAHVSSVALPKDRWDCWLLTSPLWLCQRSGETADCSRLFCGFADGQMWLLTAFTCRLEPGASDHISEIKKYLGNRLFSHVHCFYNCFRCGHMETVSRCGLDGDCFHI